MKVGASWRNILKFGKNTFIFTCYVVKNLKIFSFCQNLPTIFKILLIGLCRPSNRLKNIVIYLQELKSYLFHSLDSVELVEIKKFALEIIIFEIPLIQV